VIPIWEKSKVAIAFRRISHVPKIP